MLPIFEDELIVIENGVLRECKDNDLMTISIPDGTIAIADNVFRNCTNLIEITLPPTLTKIGSHTFEGCSSLTAVDLSNVNIIGEYAFSGCISLNEIAFSDKIGYLCNGIFLGCTGLRKITLPTNIAYIGCECFKDCSSLSDITMLSVMEIDNNAFEGCSGLCSIELPKTLMHISPNAFSFCDHLQTVQLQNRSVDIDETAFENTVNIIIQSTQYSTSYEFADRQHFRFLPAVFDEAHRIITSEQVARLAKAGVMFQMKAIDKENAVIRFDKGQAPKIESVIGKDTAVIKQKKESEANG